MTDNGENLVDVLREVAFLGGIDEEYLGQIAAVARKVEFPEGKVIFREGEPATDIFLITRGTVSLEICAPGFGCRRIMTVGQGELLSWSPVLEQTRLTATARVLSPTTAVQISGNQIVALCEHNPRFGYEFMRRAALALAKRLSALSMQLMDVYGTQLPSVPREGQS